MPDHDRIGEQVPNLYEYLQVSPRAEDGVIQAAYRALARHYHPDVSNSGNASRLMREINAAYHVLGDPTRRARYDAHRARLTRRVYQRRAVEPIDRESSRKVPAPRPSTPPRRPVGPTATTIMAIAVFASVLLSALALAIVLIGVTLDDRPPTPMFDRSAQVDVQGASMWAPPFERRLDGGPRTMNP
jgi:curved DNA-binding protein CbpA